MQKELGINILPGDPNYRMQFRCLRPIIRVIRFGFFLIGRLLRALLGFGRIPVGRRLTRMAVDVDGTGSRRVIGSLALILIGRGFYRCGRRGRYSGCAGPRSGLAVVIDRRIVGRIIGCIVGWRVVDGGIIDSTPVIVIDGGVHGPNIRQGLNMRRGGME